MNLEDADVLVTGSAKRVGRVIALTLADEGANVAVHYRTSDEAARETAEEVRERGGEAATVQSDLSTVEGARSAVDDTVNALGGIDILVNSAAVFYETPVGEVTAEDWNHNMNVNLRAPFFASQRAASHGAEKVVNIAGVGARRPYPSYLPYSVSKAGVVSLTKGLAKALAPETTVNAVSPGTVLSPDDRSDEDEKRIAEQTPVGRIGEPEDIADTVAFIVESSEFLNGAVIDVDGGRSL
ncbi:MAG: SDR family oxidoreductase [Halobacteriales archaeon]|nr:SDR family oxidoreductase [Halobacteriales archaeon]